MSAEREPLLQTEEERINSQGGLNSSRTRDIQNGKFTMLEKVLSALAAAFFIGLCVLAGLYTRRVYDSKPENPPLVPSPPGANGSSPVCTTPECVLTAAQVLQDIDMTLDPCDDFYKYSCGNWERNHEIPDGKASIGSFVLLIEQNKEILRGIFSGSFEDFYKRIHAKTLSGPLPDPEKPIDKQNFEKVKGLFDSCLNEADIDKKGAKPIYPILKEIQSQLPSSSNPADPRQLTQTLAFLANRGIGSLFEIMVDADPKDPFVNSLQLYQSGLTLPNKQYYTQDDIVDVLTSTIKDTLDIIYSHNEAAISEAGLASLNIESTAQAIVEFEKKLAAMSELPEAFQDPEATYNPMSLSELAKLAPRIDWGLYVSHLVPSSAPHPDKVVVTFPKFIGNVSAELLEKESARTLQHYLSWRAIYAYSSALGEDVRAPIHRLNSRLVGTNPKSTKPRWDVCLDEVNSALGLMAGRYFVLDKFGSEAKERADDFIDSIKEVFLKRLPQLDWIDESTRKKAEEKVHKLVRKIGYPETSPDIMSPVSLSGYYGDLTINSNDYFSNYVNARKFDVLTQWRQVGKAPDRAKWLMYPHEVNAYYNPASNEIAFPAGILQNPFFGVKYPEYLNYGGIGVVVGHELTHGFDSTGRHFDAEGRLIQWWSDETEREFEDKAKCFVKQYSNFTIIDEKGEALHVNGKLTLGENLADNGGLGQSYAAWKQRYDSDPESKQYNNVRLPGLDALSPEQLFFVNFGRIWCMKATPAQVKKGVLTDEHSPNLWRVNGAVQNSKQFAEVFNCPVGSRMNPVKKCELW